MKKKAIKIATSTAIAATAFVAANPVQADASTDVASLVKKAEDAATVLKWAISIEGTADGETRPWAAYNYAKSTLADAQAAVAKVTGTDKWLYEAKLQNAVVQKDRAMRYIDAITAGENLDAAREALETAIAGKDLNEVEKAYHGMTAQFRKQNALLDKVYGQSTRDLIRDQYKGAAEKVQASVLYDVTVKMALDKVVAANAAKDFTKANAYLAEAKKWLPQAKTFKTVLEAQLATVSGTLPINVTVDAPDTLRLAQGDTRAYTVSLTNPDGTPYIGHATILLMDASDSTLAATANLASNTTLSVATTADTTVVGAAHLQKWTGIVGSSGKVSFTIKNSVAETVRPVIILDRNANQAQDGGEVKITAGATAFYSKGVDNTAATVLFVDTTNKYFVDTNLAKYNYDSNDVFQINGYNVSLDAFASALSKQDVVKADLSDGTSVFNITTNVSSEFLTVNDVTERTTATQYTLTGKGQAGSVVAVYRDAASATKLGTVEVSANGTWSFQVNLFKDTLNAFVVKQYVKGTENLAAPVETHANTANNVKIFQGGFYVVKAESDATTTTTIGDKFTLTFTTQDDISVAAGATITVRDADGTVATFTNGYAATSFARSNVAADSVAGYTWRETLTITLGSPTSISGGDGKLAESVVITSLTGVTNQSNMTIDLTSSDIVAE
ncbi:hypothetical protein IM538_21650 [Cytobacillus suaedae]|nr:hypothetical protein IM538_21650 [Cytobacillus suaedae]